MSIFEQVYIPDKKKKKKKKRKHTVGVSIFKAESIFSAISSMPENSFELVQIGVSNKGGVKIKCHKCFIVKYGHHQRADSVCTIDAPDKK